MTIHTFEVSCTVPGDDYYLIQDKLKKSDPSKWAKEKTGMCYWGLSDKGIIRRMFITKNQKQGYYLSRICNDGRICTLSEVLKRIDMGEYRPENTKLLKEFIEYSNHFRSAAKAVSMYRECSGKKDVNRIIWMLI